MRDLHLKFRRPRFVTVIGAFILGAMAIMGALIIKNINSEYEIRNIAGKLQEYKYATLSFNNIYSGLPGDITNASFYWKDVTRDGNGNRRIEHETGEGIAAWQQLQLAKLLKFPYDLTGKWDKGDGILIPEINVPSGNNSSSGFYINYSDTFESNIIGFGQASNEAGIFSQPALTPDDAYALDLMIDDGYPDKGILRATGRDNSYCSVAGEYKKERERKECLILFKL